MICRQKIKGFTKTLGFLHILLLLLAIICITLPSPVLCVDQTKFRTCQQTGFCRRQRNKVPRNKYTCALLPTTNQNQQGPPYELLLHPGPKHTSTHPNLNLHVTPLKTGAVRIVIKEQGKERWESKDVLLPGALEVCPDSKIIRSDDEAVVIESGCGPASTALTIDLKDFTITLSSGSSTLMSLNAASLFHYEHLRSSSSSSS
eukprot:CAMPEP_0182484764 /NCGR_PEP_ID=MMETSP1319-20130603/44003_1 /TAXON_ID=172717 /ORGANISM="Bolidomonas pacifica, Strain RCC208" /LENGTH=202 /DNA_ID=CAMNT_0024686683 /DNA_START=41 /DNA_END=646 /DNA_ORIENTATION=+